MSRADDETGSAGRDRPGRPEAPRPGEPRAGKPQAGKPRADESRAAQEESFWSGYDLLWGDEADTAATRRSPLDRTRIIRAALRVADAEGLAALTMRRVATELGTGAMSLYRHVPGKEALVSLMIDEALGEDALPGQPSGDWRDDLRTLASNMWDFIQRHLWYPEAVMERPPITPRGLDAFEFALSMLDNTGLPLNERAVIVITVTSTVMNAAQNAAAEARARSRFRVTDEEVALSFSAFLGPILERGEYSRLREALTSANRLDPKEEMQVSVELILDGAAARIAAAT
jgi:AcrR family transcriptional regulator